MYVRIKTTPNSPKKAVQIVASSRNKDNGKVKQRIVRHVGYAFDGEELDRLRDLAEHIKAKILQESNPTLFKPEQLADMTINAKNNTDEDRDKALNVNLKNIREESRVIVGIHEVYGELYKQLGFDWAVGNPSRRRDAANTIKNLVLARIANPKSKRGSVADLERDFGIKLNLTSVYRSLDFIDDKQIDFIQAKAWEAASSLFQDKIDIVFYDCTTLYFETTEEDELRDKGYSKDMKFNQSQVLLALMVTKEGIPVGYRLYNGSKFEGDTLADAINHIKKQHKIGKIVFVADSAMLSEENLKFIEKNSNQKYIVGARIKSKADKVKNEILDIESYTEENGIKYKEIELENGRRLLVSYSEKRARKDEYDRLQSIEKIKKKLERSKRSENFISNFGYKKYLRIGEGEKVELNEDKIAKDRLWDGLHGVITNMEGKAEEIFTKYKGLWEIESSFRITKHDLQTRPIYHWTAKRIKSHIAICFMALSCVRHLVYRTNLQYKRLSSEQIRNELVHTQISILKHKTKEERYGLPSKPTKEAEKLYKIMNKKLNAVPFEIK